MSFNYDRDKVRRFLFEAAAEALEKIGTREQATIEESLSVPVDRDFGGNVVARSAPGEAPRTEIGLLVGGISHHITQDPDGSPVLEIVSRRDGDDPMVPEFLEYGTENMAARPYMRPAADRIREYAPD